MAPSLPSRRLAQLEGHKGAVNALTYSSGAGQYILSGSSDRAIHLWNPAKAASADRQQQSNALVQSYTGAHVYEVLSVAVTQDNSRFASGGGDKTVFLWDVSTAQTLRRYAGHIGRVECVAFGGAQDSVLVSGSFDSTVRLWDTKAPQGKPMMVLSDAKDSVSCLAVAGAEISAGSVDGRVRCYDLRMGMVHEDVIGAPVTSLTSTVQADALLVSTLDSSLRLMDKTNGKLLQTFKDASFSNENYRLRSTLAVHDALAVSGGEDGRIIAWDVISGSRVQSLQHHDSSSSGSSSSGSTTGSAASAEARKVKAVSAIASRGTSSTHWASAGGDGRIVIWGAD